ncbi:hypothetical protein JCM8208_006524 [Rhodotorula glutinis]
MHIEHPPPCPPTCTHCLAFDNHARAICSLPPSPNSKWCPVHEELQAKLLKTYKRLTVAFEAHDVALLPSRVEDIVREGDLVRLRLWSEAARHRWSLARRVIVARAEHHAQFYAGGDWGHCRFVETVRAESARMEHFLRALDQQAYSVTLAQQSASWVLDVPAGPAFICNDSPSTLNTDKLVNSPLTPPPSPPSPAARNLPRRPSGPSTKKVRQRRASSTAQPSPEAADLDAFFAQMSPSSPPPTSRDLLARLRTYLEPPADLLPTVPGSTWTSFIEAVFRHVVLRVPALATLALAAPSSLPSSPSLDTASTPATFDVAPPSSVEAFLDLLESRLAPAFVPAGSESSSEVGEREVELLWRALKFARGTPSSANGSSVDDASAGDDGLLGVGVLADALDVVFGEAADLSDDGLDHDVSGAGDGSSLVVLGARVRRDQQVKVEWPRAGWDLFYQLIACPGCTLIATRSLATWTTNRRLAALSHFPAWAVSGESTAERAFRLSRAVLCTSNSCTAGKKVKRVEQKDSTAKKGKGKKTIFLEELERSWMYIKLPVDDIRSTQILDYLASLPDRFTVLARRTATDEVTHLPPSSETSCSSGRRCSCCRTGDMWLNRVRSGFSPAERRAARWTTSSFFPRDSILSTLLKSSSPESRFHDAPYDDTYDALIFDSSPSTHDQWTAFADDVARALLEAQQCDTIGELFRREHKAALDRGEMRLSFRDDLRSCATEVERRAGAGGAGGDEPGRRSAFRCEDEWTARGIFREA